MIATLLDSFVFACPAEPTDDDVVSLIRSLLEWRDLERTELTRMFVSAQAADCLARAGGGFPPWQLIRSAIVRLELEFAPHDVFSLIQALMDRLPKIEEEVGVNEVLLEGATCTPAIHARRNEVFKAEFERLLALVCLFTERHNLAGEHVPVVLTRELNVCPTRVNFAASLEDTDPRLGRLPRQLANPVLVFDHSAEYIDNVDPVEVWSAAASQATLAAAIRLYTQRVAQQSGVEYSQEWNIGASFVQTIVSLRLQRRALGRSVLRACAETILNQNLAATHALRVSAAANSAQLRRRQDSAWRRDIDHEFHLHYWTTSEGPELAAVVQHNDFSIPG